MQHRPWPACLAGNLAYVGTEAGGQGAVSEKDMRKGLEAPRLD